MAEGRPRPLVGLPACMRISEGQSFHAAHERYVEAVSAAAAALPLIIPALGDEHDIPDLVARLDGLLLTGSPSNVEPHRYDGPPSAPGTWHDPRRDETTLPLIREALRQGLPLLAICRGHQELNVALGGTLHQRVHELPGKMDHRRVPDAPVEVEYGPRHQVTLTPGGYLHRLAGTTELTVNSLHAQAIDRLAPGLAVEATSTDDIIEAVRVENAPGFALGVQWHPEWQPLENPFSRALFAAFRAAVEARAVARLKSKRAGIAA
jgi:putative glutamine amidotransferase